MNDIVEKFQALEKTYAKYVVALFFLGYFLIGLLASHDYGIFWDEGYCRQRGQIAYESIVDRKFYLSTYQHKEYGVLFEGALVALEKGLNLSSKSRELFLMRHLVVFLSFYIGVIFFYRLVLRQFQDWKVALIGCVFLIICPRIFANSFYNSKDIPFLAANIISLYTLMRFLDKRTIPAAVWHALSTAIAVGIRTSGIFIVVFSAVFYMVSMAGEVKPARNSLGGYGAATLFFVFIFSPVLWSHPIVQLQQIINSSKNIESYVILYMGHYVDSKDAPWHYLLVNMLITIPYVYSVLFLGGCWAILKAKRRDYWIYLLWFFLPFLIDTLGRIALFDDWRHLYFIYPAFVMIALIGLMASFAYLKRKFKGPDRTIAYTILIGLIGWNVLSTSFFMVRNHPFENVYFNGLAGQDMQQVKSRFELDYWGLSYRQALEYIARTDPGSNIKICFANTHSFLSFFILPKEQQNRFQVVLKPSEAKYFLGNYRRQKDGYGCQNEYYSIAVDGPKLWKFVNSITDKNIRRAEVNV